MQSKNEIQDKIIGITEGVNIQITLLRSYCQNHIKSQQDSDFIEARIDCINSQLNKLMSYIIEL